MIYSRTTRTWEIILKYLIELNVNEFFDIDTSYMGKMNNSLS